MTALAGAVSSFAAAGSASTSTNNVTPGVLGFLVVAGIGVALVFLFRSMNKQFRKITPEPGPEPGPGPEVGEGGPGGGEPDVRSGEPGARGGASAGGEPGIGDAAKVGPPR